MSADRLSSRVPSWRVPTCPANDAHWSPPKYRERLSKQPPDWRPPNYRERLSKQPSDWCLPKYRSRVGGTSWRPAPGVFWLIAIFVSLAVWAAIVIGVCALIGAF